MNIIAKLKDIREQGKHIWSWIPGGMGNVVDLDGKTVTVEYPGKREKQTFELDGKRMKVRQADGRYFIDLRQQELLNDLRANFRKSESNT